MDKLSELKKDRSDLIGQIGIFKNRLAILDALIESYEKYGPLGNHSYEDVPENSFPLYAHPETQILWIFENHIKKGVRMKTIQDVYSYFSGKDNFSIEKYVRKLKKTEKLITVMYNGKAVYNFWGLPSWVDETDFKEEHRPDSGVLPIIEFSEVLTGENESLY